MIEFVLNLNVHDLTNLRRRTWLPGLSLLPARPKPDSEGSRAYYYSSSYMSSESLPVAVYVAASARASV